LRHTVDVGHRLVVTAALAADEAVAERDGGGRQRGRFGRRGAGGDDPDGGEGDGHGGGQQGTLQQGHMVSPIDRQKHERISR
jgi:hypothetical protein